jgi:branched-chain amino acid transport system substrate-binding protein
VSIIKKGFDRRTILKAGAAVAAAGGVSMPAYAQARTIKVGYVSPQTGPLAAMAEADGFTLNAVRAAIGAGLDIGGRTYPVEFIVKDSQSNPNRASEVANELILQDEIDLMLVSWTPENVNPVADACELNEVPCLSNGAPWQAYYMTRGGDPAGPGFDWTYHFFWGFEDILAVFGNMWDKIDTNKQVGALLANDADGNAWGDPVNGIGPAFAARDYTVTDPGRYQNLSDDFTSYITAFKNAGCEIVTGVPLPPDFTIFWTQARQQGFRPKAVSVGKATLFPVAVEALGDAGDRLSSEVWWSPSHPFSSSLTGQSAAELADAYTQSTGRQWTQPIGLAHSLFEVGIDILKRSGGPGDAAAIRDAMAATNLDTVFGPVAWGSGPVKNVAKTPLVGGQWRLTDGGPFKYDIVVTSNETYPDVPLGGEMEPIV